MINDETITASESLQLRLEEAILSREYLPGDRLPSEHDIMGQLKVGRRTVREAYRSLQQKGLIETKHGGGAFVREVDSSMVGDTLSTLIRHRRVSTQHLLEFREAFESRCAAYSDILPNQSEKPEEASQDWRNFIQAVENREVNGQDVRDIRETA